MRALASSCSCASVMKETMKPCTVRLSIPEYLSEVQSQASTVLVRGPKWRGVHSNGRAVVKDLTGSIHWKISRFEVIVWLL